MKRKKEDMSEDIFRKSIDACKTLVGRGTQKELWLHGIGESLLHPQLLDFCAIARKELPDLKIRLSTNAILITEEIVNGLVESKISIYISLHQPAKAAKGVLVAQSAGIVEELSINAVTAPSDWAGQLNWPQTVHPAFCGYLKNGWAVILADGYIDTCCVDADKEGVIGHINDWEKALLKPYSLCKPCHLMPPMEI
tara:strand:- start:5886 stop:6473 length:588 start_codon:yes stop_codon:yes gene_type:complete